MGDILGKDDKLLVLYFHMTITRLSKEEHELCQIMLKRLKARFSSKVNIIESKRWDKERS